MLAIPKTRDVSLSDYLPKSVLQSSMATALPPTMRRIDRFVQVVEQWQERPIETIAWNDFPVGLFGARIATRKRDYIVYEANTTLIHREHIIAHELGHIIPKHSIVVVSDKTNIERAIANLLLRSLRQDSYEEMEAEAIALAIQIEFVNQDTSIQTESTLPGWKKVSKGLGWS